MKKGKMIPYFIYPCIIMGISLVVLIFTLIFADKSTVLLLGICLAVINCIFLLSLAIHYLLPQNSINMKAKYGKLITFLNIFMKFVAIALFILIVVQTIKAIATSIEIIKAVDQVSDIGNVVLYSMGTASESDLVVVLWLIELITKDLLIYVAEIFAMVLCLVLKFDTNKQKTNQKQDLGTALNQNEKIEQE